MSTRIGVLNTVCWTAATLLLPLAASAAPPVPTNLPNTMAHLAPPAAFNAVTASPEALLDNGFPPRPDAKSAPQAYERWQHAVTSGATRILPQLRQTTIKHGPRMASSRQNGTSPNWSGYAVVNGTATYSGPSFSFIIGDWVVPGASQAIGACTGTWDYSSTWVGIDGYNSNDVLQAGTESDAYCGTDGKAIYSGAWYEWFPLGEVAITNLPTAPGDDMYVQVYSTTPTTGHAYILNYSKNQAVSLTFKAPAGTVLVGNSAEWIVERPGIGGGLATLTNYTQDFMTNAYAQDFLGRTEAPGYVIPGSVSVPLTMLDNAGSPISQAVLSGTASLWFYNLNSALNASLP